MEAERLPRAIRPGGGPRDVVLPLVGAQRDPRFQLVLGVPLGRGTGHHPSLAAIGVRGAGPEGSIPAASRSLACGHT
jgi:hypothetical protein